MPWGSSLFPLLIITAGGGFTGLFEYSPAPGTGNLILSSTAANGTDPFGNAFFQGLATYAPSLGHSFVVNLLSTGAATQGFFQYNAPSGGVQGGLILAVSSSGGAADPVTSVAYPAGLYGLDPVFGDSFTGVGANIALGQVAYTRAADVVARTASGATTNPFLLIDAPEQTTAEHLQVLLQGFSPDGTTSPPQMLVGQVSGAALLTAISTAMVEIQGGTGQAVLRLDPAATANTAMSVAIPTDTNPRFQVIGSGKVFWGSGTAAVDTAIERLSANRLGVDTADLAVHTVGRGLQVAEGSNAKQGIATLAAGTVTVANTSVTANSKIFCTCQILGTVTVASTFDTPRTAGTSFTIHASQATDTSTVAWEIFEPG